MAPTAHKKISTRSVNHNQLRHQRHDLRVRLHHRSRLREAQEKNERTCGGPTLLLRAHLGGKVQPKGDRNNPVLWPSSRGATTKRRGRDFPLDLTSRTGGLQYFVFTRLQSCLWRQSPSPALSRSKKRVREAAMVTRDSQVRPCAVSKVCNEFFVGRY